MIIELISIGWFTNIIVKFWINTLWKYPNLRSLKPMSCQMCLGFWFGFTYYHSQSIEKMIIFGALSSLSAVILNGLINFINKP